MLLSNLCHMTVLLFIILFLIACGPSYSQAELTLPSEFQNLSINARALRKKIDFTLDSSTINTSQNFVLDKAGLILHLVPVPKIKDENTKLKIFSNDGTEIETYKFIDDTVFALVDPQKSYSIFEEIVPKCDDFIKAFGFEQISVICPDTELFKLYGNIIIDKDTSFKINLQKPGDFYSATLILPEDTQLVPSDDFTNIHVDLDSGSSLSLGFQRPSVNIANLLSVGNLCFIGKKKNTSKSELANCSFVNNNVNSIITFKNSFKDKDISVITPNIVFSYTSGRFNSFLHTYVFEFSEDIKSKNTPLEINASSPQKYFFENNDSSFSINLGQILTAVKKNRKNVFSLTNPIEINKTLNDNFFSVPLDKTEAIITLTLSNMSFDTFLSNISLTANENLSNVYNLSTNNNIIIKNFSDPDSEINNKKRFETTTFDSLLISSYLPDMLSDLKIIRDYTFVEQVVAPSVDDKGKPIEVINNKSKADLSLSKSFSNIDLTDRTSPFSLLTEKPSVLLNNKLFTKQGSITGFLSPPDFRPVLEDGYRANITFTMTVNLTNNEALKMIYTDLKTKNETPLANFFSFSFLPLGKYEVDLKFDSDRTKLFEKAGLIKSSK